MTPDLAHPCPVCSAPAGEPHPRACPECGALPGVPCPGGHTHDRRDPTPVDWRARHVRDWTAQGRLPEADRDR